MKKVLYCLNISEMLHNIFIGPVVVLCRSVVLEIRKAKRVMPGKWLRSLITLINSRKY